MEPISPWSLFNREINCFRNEFKLKTFRLQQSNQKLTERHVKTEKLKDNKQTNRLKDIKRKDKQKNRHGALEHKTNRQIEKETKRQTNTLTNRHVEEQTSRQADM